MFDAIAARYDVLNRVLSGGLDQRWRARAVRALALQPTDTLLDLCTGTADVAIAAATADAAGAARDRRGFLARDAAAWSREGRGTGVAPSGRSRQGDAMRLPLADGSVDAAAISFGIRNVQAPEIALR